MVLREDNVGDMHLIDRPFYVSWIEYVVGVDDTVGIGIPMNMVIVRTYYEKKHTIQINL